MNVPFSVFTLLIFMIPFFAFPQSQADKTGTGKVLTEKIKKEDTSVGIDTTGARTSIAAFLALIIASITNNATVSTSTVTK